MQQPAVISGDSMSQDVHSSVLENSHIFYPRNMQINHLGTLHIHRSSSHSLYDPPCNAIYLWVVATENHAILPLTFLIIVYCFLQLLTDVWMMGRWQRDDRGVRLTGGKVQGAQNGRWTLWASPRISEALSPPDVLRYVQPYGSYNQKPECLARLTESAVCVSHTHTVMSWPEFPAAAALPVKPPWTSVPIHQPLSASQI